MSIFFSATTVPSFVLTGFGSNWKRLFESFDADGDGKLSESEFRRAVHSNKHVWTQLDDATIAALFHVLDANEDGSIGMDEFLSWFAKDKSATDAVRNVIQELDHTLHLVSTAMLATEKRERSRQRERIRAHRGQTVVFVGVALCFTRGSARFAVTSLRVCR